MNKNLLQHVVKYLELLQTAKGREAIYFDEDWGICSNLGHYITERFSDRKCERTSAWLEEQFAHWPEYSGNSDYPIWVCTELSPSENYGLPKWDGRTKVGRARMRLVKFLIDRAKEQL